MEKQEHTLEWLLDYDGRRHFFASGHFVKFEIRLVAQSDQVPHGFDNAHPVPHVGGKFVKAKPEADHWHRTVNDEGRPYAFVSAAQLLDDFFAEVEMLCEAQGISTEVVDDKETRL